MTISLNWIKDYFDLDLPPEKVAEVLTGCGLEVEEINAIKDDYVFEIGLTPNRNDANSHIGVARDLCAALNFSQKTNFKLKRPDVSKFKVDNTSNTIPVEVSDAKSCPRYSGITISNIVVKASPEWLIKRLEAIGVRSINNVVDVTNYILHEYGQPLHAFDADKIRGAKVVVRHEPQGTIFKTLDEKNINLHADDLIICDAEGGMCIAGVYGGYESGVKYQTKNIFLESAYFSPVSTRKTSIRHNLRTDAATLFEKGCDPNVTVEALKRAALMIKEVAGGDISSEIIDLYPAPIEGFRFPVSYKKIMELSGFTIEKEVIKSILTNLEIKIEKEDNETLHLLVPAFKNDVRREADIIEEILRIYGYNNIELSDELSADFLAKVNYEHSYFHQFDTSRILSANGFLEIICNSLTNLLPLSDYYDPINTVEVVNSKSIDLHSMRRSLLTSGLEAISYNIKHRQQNIKFFEFGKIYGKTGSKFNERRMLSLLITGKISEESWSFKSKDADVFKLLSVVKMLLKKYGIKYSKQPTERNNFAYCMDLIDDRSGLVGIVGLVDSRFAKHYDIKKEVFYAELNWEYILSSQETQHFYKEINKFPEVRRDLSLVIDKKVNYVEIEKLVFEESNDLLKKINVFDIFEDEKLGADKKSISLSFILQSDERTLTDEEAEKVMNSLIGKFESKLDAVIRK